ncbi:MAG: hypothetical protein LBH62_05565 [Nitrososphaerota archaeon]|nr:hypothetical protein [Nitrososphaerota archaeon]
MTVIMYLCKIVYNTEKVINVKPYPIPDITGQVAEDFERDIKNGPTEQQKERMKRATVKFAKANQRQR